MTVLPSVPPCVVRWGARAVGVSCLLLATAVPAHAQCPSCYQCQWGSFGSLNGQFKQPQGIAIDSVGNKYVADYGNNRVQKFASCGAYICQWGSLGSGNGQFNGPIGVAIDSFDNVYVTDRFNNRVQKFAPGPLPCPQYVAQWGTLGSGAGQFNYPADIATDTFDNVYVADSDNHRIQKFTGSGSFLLMWGMPGCGNGKFSDGQWLGTWTDPGTNNVYVYVTDYTCNRVQKFDSFGTFLCKWGMFGPNNGEFHTPADVAIDAAGHVYVADSVNNRVQKFDSCGTYLCQWGSQGTGDGQFDNAAGLLVIDPAGEVYVGDYSNNRIEKFAGVDLLCTFTPDRFGNIPPDRMQVVAMYDGNGTASLTIELQNVAGGCCDIVIPIINFGTKIVTLEYDMNGFEPTGEFTVSGAAPNGGIDGVAFGLYSRSVSGERWLLRSRNLLPGTPGPDFVGGWPIAFPESQWNSLLVDIDPSTCGLPPSCTMCGCLNANGSPCAAFDLEVARRQAQMTLSGAQLLSNGTWNIPTGRVPGDCNGDGCVDGSDLGCVLGGWKICCPP